MSDLDLLRSLRSDEQIARLAGVSVRAVRSWASGGPMNAANREKVRVLAHADDPELASASFAKPLVLHPVRSVAERMGGG